MEKKFKHHPIKFKLISNQISKSDKNLHDQEHANKRDY